MTTMSNSNMHNDSLLKTMRSIQKTTQVQVFKTNLENLALKKSKYSPKFSINSSSNYTDIKSMITT